MSAAVKAIVENIEARSKAIAIEIPWTKIWAITEFVIAEKETGKSDSVVIAEVISKLEAGTI